MPNIAKVITSAGKYLISPASRRIPIRILPHYNKWLKNPEIPDFGKWQFDPGMRFNDADPWWKFGVPRKELHNGIDLFRYLSREGCSKDVPIGTKIVNIYDGEIAKVTPDFIRSSVFVKHDIFSGNLQFYTIFGHIKIAEGLKEKDIIKSGILLGEIAGIPAGSGALPHLHLSMAWLPKDIAPCFLNWRDLGENFFINPLF